MDFSRYIDLDRFKSTILSKSDDNNYDPIIEAERRADEYLTYLFENTLYLLVKNQIHDEAKNLLVKYFGCYKNLEIASVEDEFDDLERQEIEALFLPDHIDISIKENNLVVLKMLSDKLIKKIISNLQIYSKEQLLKIFYTNASILSYLSIHSNNWGSGGVDINQMNLIAEALSIVMDNYKDEATNFIGTEKKTMEFLVHLLLNSDAEFNAQNINSTENLMEILVYVRLLLYIEQLKSNHSLIYKSGSSIRIIDNHLIVSEPFAIRFRDYMKNASEEKINISSAEVNYIFKEFEKRRGYSPFLLEDYLFNYDEKFLETRTMAAFIEEEALIRDIQYKSKQQKEVVQQLLNDLTLKSMQRETLIKEVFSNNRIFRTPIIKISSFYLVSYQMLLEASNYFRYRILKNELDTNLNRSLNNLVKENFNEIGLHYLKDIIVERNLIGEINFSLNNNNKCKHIFQNQKDLPQEVDCYFIVKNQLYIIELKNRDLQRSLFEVSKSIDKAKKDLQKLSRLKKVIFESKRIMEDVFNSEFDDINIYITHKYPHFLDGTYDTEHEVNIMSFENFLKYFKKIKSY
ncbi:MAG: hypothetical protein NAG76_02140 [Candidatus Pristimantibacillus lignocellulolyticus]|uniref:NERD domain-containing protein n=1 Tax=Candidatus Pristimantibacillus lignocellulolyticus TaxID=2994561 RepID=A0A9J6ZH77_9BACL|nr:MAG: hypothetical protein NAG76_02140 [Candidatus Pristimantibacillus lignocellulolyticus]